MPRNTVAYILLLLAIIFSGTFVISTLSSSPTNQSVLSRIESSIPPHTQTAALGDLTSGLVAHYTFDDGTATDNSGQGHTGSVSGATATQGKIGQALQFGTGNTVNAGNIVDADNIDQMTVATWVKLDSNHSPNFISKYQNGLGTWVISYSSISRAYTCRLFNNSGSSITRSSPTYSSASHPGVDGRWHHVACVYDGASVGIYTDGQSQGSTPFSGLLKDTNYPMCLGSQSSLGVCNAGTYLQGALDDVRVYRRALSSSEISELYCAGEPTAPSCGGAGQSTTPADSGGSDQTTTPSQTPVDSGATPSDQQTSSSGNENVTNPPTETIPQDRSGYLVTPATIMAGIWKPIVGIPEPPFGIKEDVTMYILLPGENCNNTPRKCYDYGRGLEVYHLTAEGEPFTHYIDNTDPNSTNTNNPFGTIQKPRSSAPLHLTEGSIVYFHKGTYSYSNLPGGSKLGIGGMGTASRPIFIRGSRTSSNTHATISTQTLTLVGSYVILENLVFDQSRINTRAELIKDASGQIVYPNSDHLVFRNLEIKGSGSRTTGTALQPSGGVANNYNVVYNNTIHDIGDWRVVDDAGVAIPENDMSGITIPATGANNIWIIDNAIYHMGGDSIRYGSNFGPTDPAVNPNASWVGSRDINVNASLARNIYIGRNTLHDNHENAVDIKYSNNAVISENKMHGFKKVSSSSGEAVVIHYEPNNIWFINNDISDAVLGIVSTGVVNLYVWGNYLHDTYYGISFRGGGNLNYIGNTIVRVASGVHQDGSGNPTIINNIFSDYQVDKKAINISDTVIASKAIISHNLFNQDDIKFTNIIQNDPSLQPGSAAIDAGDSSIMSQLMSQFKNSFGIDLATSFKDMYGISRPQGVAWDIGAYEFSSSGSGVPPVSPSTLPGDFNNDKKVNTVDFSLLSTYWNQSNTTFDLTGDGLVNTLDYVVMVKNWTR